MTHIAVGREMPCFEAFLRTGFGSVPPTVENGLSGPRAAPNRMLVAGRGSTVVSEGSGPSCQIGGRDHPSTWARHPYRNSGLP